MIIFELFRLMIILVAVHLIENQEEGFRQAVIIKKHESTFVSEKILIGYPSCPKNKSNKEKLEPEGGRVIDQSNNISQKLELKIEELERRLNNSLGLIAIGMSSNI